MPYDRVAVSNVILTQWERECVCECTRLDLFSFCFLYLVISYSKSTWGELISSDHKTTSYLRLEVSCFFFYRTEVTNWKNEEGNLQNKNNVPNTAAYLIRIAEQGTALIFGRIYFLLHTVSKG